MGEYLNECVTNDTHMKIEFQWNPLLCFMRNRDVMRDFQTSLMRWNEYGFIWLFLFDYVKFWMDNWMYF